MSLSNLIKSAAVAAIAFGILMLPGLLAGAGARPSRTPRVSRRRAIISPRAMPVSSAMPPRPRPITGRRCGPTRRTPNCSSAPSSRRWPRATSTRRSGSPTGCCRSTRTTASRGSCSACARSRTSNGRPRARTSRNPCAGRSPTSTAALLIAWTPVRRQRFQGRDRDDRPAAGPGLVRDLQGPACRPDPRHRRQEERSQAPLREGAQARRHQPARGRGLWQLPVAQGNKDEALEVYQTFEKALPRHPLIDAGDETRSRRARNCRRWSRTRRPAPPKCCTASAPRSAAAAARISGLAYLQLALYLEPRHPLALLSLADLYEAMKKPQLGDRRLRAGAGGFAAASQCRNPARHQSRFARKDRRGQGASARS